MQPNLISENNRKQINFNTKVDREKIINILSLKRSISQYEHQYDQRIRTIQDLQQLQPIVQEPSHHQHKQEKSSKQTNKHVKINKKSEFQVKSQSQRVLKRRQAIQKNKVQLLRGNTQPNNLSKIQNSKTKSKLGHKKYNSIDIKQPQVKSTRIFRKTQTISQANFKDEPNLNLIKDNIVGRLKIFMEKYKSSCKLDRKRQTAADKQHQEIQNIVNRMKAESVFENQKMERNNSLEQMKANLQFCQIDKAMIQKRNIRATIGAKIGMKARFQLRKQIKIKTILKDRYQILEKIGHGLSGQVYKGRDILGQRFVAIKILNKNSKNEGQYQFYKKISHRNIVSYYNNFIQNGQRYLILQYFPHTLQKMAKTRKFEEEELKKIFKNIANGLLFLHGISIAHRDIKLDNIVISDDLNVVKFIDFGLCIDLNQLQNQQSQQFCGTIQFMSPQILLKKSYAPKNADIWSLGVLLYRLAFDRYPYRGNDERQVLQRIQKTKLIFPEGTGSDFKILIDGMLKKNPSQRLSILDIIQNSWLQ